VTIPTHCIHGHELTPENLYVGPKRWGCRPCGRAYQARYLAGDTHKTTRTRRPLEELYTVAESGCWEWNGYVNPNGYASMKRRSYAGRTTAHRVFYEELVGPIPEGMHLDHLCMNTICVRPDHCEPVTFEENQRRAAVARTHCPQGHPYEEWNVYRPPSRPNVRHCKTCLGWRNHAA
jgi:hypothetical protein